MRAVHFEDIEARLQGALGCRAKGGDDLQQVGVPQFARHDPTRADRLGARRASLPRPITAREVRLIERSVAEPRALHARLASGVAELNRRLRRIGVYEIGDAAKRRDLFVAPQSQIAVRDAAALLHRRGLDKHQPGAAGSELAEVHQVPVVGAAVVGRVLTHGRDHYAVLQANTAQVERLK